MSKPAIRFALAIILTVTIGASSVLVAGPLGRPDVSQPVAGAAGGLPGLNGPVVKAASPGQPIQAEDGSSVTLEAFRGKIVLLNFWATWCPPCVQELPALDTVQGRLGGKGFQVVPVSTDVLGASAVRKFYRQHGIKHLPVFKDVRGRLAQAMGVQGLPTTFVLDVDGSVIGTHTGFKHWDDPAFMSTLADLIDLSG